MKIIIVYLLSMQKSNYYIIQQF